MVAGGVMAAAKVIVSRQSGGGGGGGKGVLSGPHQVDLNNLLGITDPYMSLICTPARCIR